MYKYKISYREHERKYYVDIYHHKKFSKEEFFEMYKEAFRKIEEKYGDCDFGLEDYLEEHFGFVKNEEIYEINLDGNEITLYDKENDDYCKTDSSIMDFSKKYESVIHKLFYSKL